MRWIPALVALVSIAPAGACQPGSSGTPGTITPSGSPDGGAVTCPGDPSCAPPAASGYVDTPATVEQAMKALVSKGCARFHSDCAYLCDGIWYECGQTPAQCVADQTAVRMAYFEHPVVDTALAATCAQDVAKAACADVPPSTVACDFAFVEGCLDDHDDLGQAYSWVNPHVVTGLPVTLTVHLCDEAEEWLRLDLDKGQELVLAGLGEGPVPGSGSVRAALHAPPDADDDEPFFLDSRSFSWDADDDPTTLGPVNESGVYYVELTVNGLPHVDVQIGLEARAHVE